MKYGVLLSALLFPVVTQAAIIDFQPTSGRFTDLGTDGFFADGTWSEDGFDVGFEYENAFGGLGQVVDEFAGGPGLNDSGCCFGEFTRLTFDRPDAQPFTLREIDYGSTTASYFGDVEFVPFAADGTRDFSRAVREVVDVAPANVVLKGVKANGVETALLLNSYFNSDFIGGVGGPDPSFSNPAPYALTPEQVRIMSDLAFLDVTVGGQYSIDRSREARVADAINTLRNVLAFNDLDDLFDQGFEQCIATGQVLGRCSFEDFGEFSFYYETNASGNYGSRVFFDSFTFDVGDTATVPLPASLPLLLGGLGVFGFMRGRRKATK